MDGPWTRYQQAPPQSPAEGPWTRFQQPSNRRGAGVSATPDGRTVAPGTTEEEAARVPPGMVFDPQTGGYADAALQAQRMPQGSGAAASFLAGAPFVGEWMDEGLGNAAAAATGQTPEVAVERARQSREQFSEANPKTALGLEIGGAVTGAVPMALAAGPAILSRAATPIGKGITGLAAGAAAGAVEGAAQGAGRNDQDRASGAMTGGVIGGAVGGVAGVLAPIVGAGVKRLAARVKALDISTIAQELGISSSAARVIRSAVANDDLAAAQTQLRRLGDDAMLADAGPSTANLLDASAQTGGAALRTTSNAVSRRANDAGQAMTQTLDDILGAPVGQREGARNIAQRTASARQAAYQRAYEAPVDYASEAGRRVEEVLTRIPDRTLRDAISEANEAMQAAGSRNMQIMANIAEDGSVTFREMPNVQQLDEIKKALGNIGRAEVDQFGRPTGAGIRANQLAADLRGALGDAVPAYNRAVRLGGDKIAEDRAYDVGLNLLTRRTTPEDVADVLRSGGAEARLAARNGLRANIEETLSNVRRTITDPNVDAREAMQLVKEMSSRANRRKVQMVLGPERTTRLYRELERSEAALALRAAVSRNSATAIRQATAGQVADEVQPGLLRRTLGRGGNPLEAAQQVTESLAGIDPRSMSQAQKQIFDEIAETLVNTRGADARRALVAVRRAMQGQPMRDGEAELIGRVVGSSAYVGSLEAGDRALGSRAR